MNDLRKPVEFPFTDRQADLMRRIYAKAQGQIIRGQTNIATADLLQQAGLVSMNELARADTPALIVNFTPKGREAWHNFCLKAAGRKPVCLI